MVAEGGGRRSEQKIICQNWRQAKLSTVLPVTQLARMMFTSKSLVSCLFSLLNFAPSHAPFIYKHTRIQPTTNETAAFNTMQSKTYAIASGHLQSGMLVIVFLSWDSLLYSFLFTTTDTNASLHFGPPMPPVISFPVCPVRLSLSPKRNPALVEFG